MNHNLIFLSIFLVFSFLLQAQDYFDMNSLKGTTWHQYEIQKEDTIQVFNKGNECAVPVELSFQSDYDTSNYKMFRKDLTVIHLGFYNTRFCSNDPITYEELEEINSCPDYLYIHSLKNQIWYRVGESTQRKEYKLISYKKEEEIILKGKRNARGEKLIFRKQNQKK